jgi:hypothetical protein
LVFPFKKEAGFNANERKKAQRTQMLLSPASRASAIGTISLYGAPRRQLGTAPASLRSFAPYLRHLR